MKWILEVWQLDILGKVSIILGTLYALLLVLYGTLLVISHAKKWAKKRNTKKGEVEGVLTEKKVCRLRKQASDVLEVFPECYYNEMRGANAYELIVYIACVDGYVFVERVNERFYDKVTPPARVTVLYDEDKKTRDRVCRDIVLAKIE